MKKRSVLLTTDLYHPHNDPNDHWNLATMYSLAKRGLIKFAGIMCDEDKPDRVRGYQTYGDPSVESIAQLNYITGISVPAAIGSHKPMKCEEDIEEVLSSGIIIPSANLLISVLEETDAPVDIHLCGSCRDVLLASRMRPDLFTMDRVRIFLNAGTYVHQDILEYNVSLEPYSFSQMFDIPCQIMWSPCFDSLHEDRIGKVVEHANFYSMYHEDVIPYLSRQMKNYFLYMYSQEKEIGWLTYIQKETNEELLEKWSRGERWMWSTAGFLMSAGINILPDGTETEEADPDAVCTYLPVIVKCRPDGRLDWKLAEEGEETHVKMFTVRDTSRFESAMAGMVKKLLLELP